MKVTARIMAFNEAETIHLTIAHYKQICSHIILYDNHSTDNTKEIAKDLGCEIVEFGIPGVLDDREYTKLKNNIWKGSDSDWEIIVDADEILDVSLLSLSEELGRSSILTTFGWQVVSHDFPSETWFDVTRGYPYSNYSKMCCFNPKHIKEIGYVHGCHVAKPQGKVYFSHRLYMLLHYRNVGGPQRLVDRHAMYRTRMSDWNIKWNAGSHYRIADEQRIKEWEEQYEKSQTFVPLGGSLSALKTTRSAGRV